MKLAMFGGSFNPVHNGHVEMARFLRSKLQMDQVLVIPAGKPPHKSDADYAPDVDRLTMCRLAFGDLPGTQVNDMEIAAGGVSYTYKTLQALHTMKPDAQLHLACGSDMFLTLQNWREPDEIFRLAVICAFPRAGETIQVMQAQQQTLEARGARVLLCECALPHISSTDIRRRISQGKSVENLVPDAVNRYLWENNLYRG